MLRKLLKYDLKAVLKLWWIPALAAILLALVGAGCMRITTSDRPINSMIVFVAGMTELVVQLGIMAFGLIASIITYGRFYKNFFTDEGYLTFTLPVTRGQLLTSKLVTQVLVSFLTGLVTYLSMFLMESLGTAGFFDMFKETGEAESSGGPSGGWILLYLVELLLILGVGSLFSVLFTDCCITFGSIIAKKAKLVTSIGIYFGANWLFSGIAWTFVVFGLVSLGLWLTGVRLEAHILYLFIGIILFCVFAMLSLLCSLLYTLMYWMLDRKLNLP